MLIHLFVCLFVCVNSFVCLLLIGWTRDSVIDVNVSSSVSPLICVLTLSDWSIFSLYRTAVLCQTTKNLCLVLD